GGLDRLGLGEGDVACIMLRNDPAFLQAVFGARLLGAYSCPINWHYKSDEAGWILRDSGARILVISEELHSQIAGGIPSEVSVIRNWEAWSEKQTPWSGAPRTPRTSMPYTSGTTGRAKGVRRASPTPEQLELGRRCTAQALGVEAGMRALLSGPLYHSAPNG